MQLKRNLFFLLGAILLGGVVFCLHFGFDFRFVRFTNYEWLLRGDVGQQFVGWLYFLRGPWTFPVGRLDDYLTPVGAYLSFTDSAPWFAIVMKLFKGYFPSGVVQITGLWFLLCFLLQGLFAGTLAIVCKLKGFAAWILVIFLVTTPVLAFRFGHPALCAQWMVLAAFTLFLAPRGRKYLLLVGWWILLLLAAATQPYLCAMIFPFYLLYLWAISVAQRYAWERGIPWFIGGMLAALAGCGAVFMALGYASAPSISDAGFGWFGADLNTLFNSFGRSLLVPAIRSGAGSYEGFAWLGSGGWLLLIGMLFFLFRREESGWFLKQFLPKKAGQLFALAVLLSIFALGEHVRVFGKWLLQLEWFYAWLDPVTGMLRACGRFVWPLHYALLLIPLLYLAARLSRRVMIPFFAVCAVLQVVEQVPLFLHKEPLFYFWPQTANSAVRSLDPEVWGEMGRIYRHLALIPPQFYDTESCVPGLYSKQYYLPFAVAAWQQGMTFNSGARARISQEMVLAGCEKELWPVLNAQFDVATLYVVHPTWLPYFQTGKAAALSHCDVYDGYSICRMKQAEAQDL